TMTTLVAMRLWSVHPRYFDRQALTACWREALLAQAVLAGATKGYRQHPQLERFREHPAPEAAVARFLSGIADEADDRGYNFTRNKIGKHAGPVTLIPVTSGQLAYEWAHLKGKLASRSPAVAKLWADLTEPEPHPVFVVVDGPIATWERPSG
ncbi:MAG: pyrimidine dimer DNA glycosylase/endonuclease V, partial [Lacisediminihabitans sp.]